MTTAHDRMTVAVIVSFALLFLVFETCDEQEMQELAPCMCPQKVELSIGQSAVIGSGVCFERQGDSGMRGDPWVPLDTIRFQCQGRSYRAAFLKRETARNIWVELYSEDDHFSRYLFGDHVYHVLDSLRYINGLSNTN